MNDTIRIHQIFYEEYQLRQLDPAFIQLDARRSPEAHLFEIYWLLKLFDSGFHNEADLTGAVSWRFSEKTQLTGREFIEFIKKNPGFDVYFVNPYPQLAYRFFNVWEQGENAHPGIKTLAQNLMDDADYGLSIEEMGRNDNRTLLYCNYWAGNSRFWREYISYVKPLFACSTNAHRPRDKNPYFRMTKYHLKPAPFFPFIFERLFSTFLLANDSVKACPYIHGQENTLIQFKTQKDKDDFARSIRLIDDLDGLFRHNGGSEEHRRLFKSLVKERGRKSPNLLTDAAMKTIPARRSIINSSRVRPVHRVEVQDV